MGKVKYYQMAFKNGNYRKLISPSQKQINSLIDDGWIVKGSVNPFNFVNPILDDNVIREKTKVELEAEIVVKKLSRKIFNFREIMTACDTIDTANGNTILRTKLNAIAENDEFKLHLIGAGGVVDLNDNVTIQAMAIFSDNEIQSILMGI